MKRIVADARPLCILNLAYLLAAMYPMNRMLAYMLRKKAEKPKLQKTRRVVSVVLTYFMMRMGRQRQSRKSAAAKFFR